MKSNNSSSSNNNNNNITYKAAVVQYRTEGIVGKSKQINSTTNAKEVLQINLKNYDRIVEKATKVDKAQIIVFPEWGLFGRTQSSWCGSGGGLSPATSRKLLRPFAQTIPKVNTRILEERDDDDNDDDYDDDKHNVVVRLAEIAYTHRVIIVANVAELVINESTDDDDDGGGGNDNENNCKERIYNTEVAISEDGILLGKYHKTHPFFKKTFDRPLSTDTTNSAVTFRSNFGVEFGLFICKDLFHAEPQGMLLKSGVRHFPFSVAMPSNWLSRWKFQSWALKNNALLLASNLGRGQSGVFGCSDGILEVRVRVMTKDIDGFIIGWREPKTRRCWLPCAKTGVSRHAVEEGYVVAKVTA